MDVFGLSYAPVRGVLWAARLAAAFVFLSSLIILVGHLAGLNVLYRPLPHGPATHPLTAILTVCLAAGLVLVSPTRRVDGAARFLFALAAGLAAARLFEMLALASPQTPIGATFDGLQHAGDHRTTGVNTLIVAILIAVGQLLRDGSPRIAFVLAGLSPVGPLIAAFGYTFGFAHFYGEMSPVTAALLMPLSLIGLMSFVRRPTLRPLFADGPLGRGLRIELLAGLAFPWAVGAVLASREVGGSSTTAIQSALMAFFAMTVVLIKSRAHAATDRSRQRSARALQTAAVTDHLTGLANRHGASRRIDALRASRPVGVILADLDHFKMINDIHGHAVGDRVLVEAANAFKECLRPGQVVARWGGEEFLVILPGCDVDATLAIAERLRAGLTTLCGPAGSRGEITASFGVSERFEAETTLDGALHRADVALYAAKDSGRDRVVRDSCAGCTGASTAAFNRDRLHPGCGAAA